MSTPHWKKYTETLYRHEGLDLSLDISRMNFPEGYFSTMAPATTKALADMKALEGGAIANPDEKRMVGHYWLRNPAITPDAALKKEIIDTLADVKQFAASVHSGAVRPPKFPKFERVLIVGIGGSALGPQLLADALGTSADKMHVHFLDNTDPEGMARVLTAIGTDLGRTLVLVISKSGGTPETRNGMLEVQAAYQARGLDFAPHAVAITGVGSNLDKVAVAGGWLKRFPMWDWVGGRTSVMSTVGLVGMALQGIDIDAFLEGAKEMDAATRAGEVRQNPALLLALMWHHAGSGRGAKDMVVLPYKDRLVLFSKYLQQLVMESLGKEKDLDGKTVHQGIAVYGNKGSTDQHAYVQQLRDGINNFFATFIEVRQAGGARVEVDPGFTSGDYLQGFLRGTRAALSEGGRENITVSIAAVSPRTLGALIALYERAVGFYASFVNINAYHQPGVEAGKKAASRLLELQSKTVAALASASASGPVTAETLAAGLSADPEDVYHVLNHLAANGGARVTRGTSPALDQFTK
ncbi:MAG: glucose-6-phosphate isomerase [Candidatus Methylacidiphilales bacterium]|nr:glucose-6-phosphate isomerase [Candidatus Methylacidiphilales bacterium]